MIIETPRLYFIGPDCAREIRVNSWHRKEKEFLKKMC